MQTGFVPTKALPYGGCKKLFSLTFLTKSAMMETKKKCFVSVMRDAIIQASIESLRQEGLKFSVDTLSDKMKISKKTVYKYFPDKQTLAVALYKKYYSDATAQAERLIDKNSEDSHRELLKLYFDSKVMTCSKIFNKYKLNQMIYAYTTKESDILWEVIAASFCAAKTDEEKKALRIIVDGTFEKLCLLGSSPDYIIDRLMDLLW